MSEYFTTESTETVDRREQSTPMVHTQTVWGGPDHRLSDPYTTTADDMIASFYLCQSLYLQSRAAANSVPPTPPFSFPHTPSLVSLMEPSQGGSYVGRRPNGAVQKTKQKTGNETAKLYILTFLSRKYWKMVTVFSDTRKSTSCFCSSWRCKFTEVFNIYYAFPFPLFQYFHINFGKEPKDTTVRHECVCVRERERSRDHLVFLLLCSPLLTDHYGSLWINWSLEALARDVGWQLRKNLPLRAGHESRAGLTYGLFIPPPDINEQNKETWTLWNDRGLRNKVCHEEKPTQFFF